MDCQFPLIRYSSSFDEKKWGERHGEEFRLSIQNLAEIRRELMLERSPELKDHLEALAKEQWDKSVQFAPKIMQELEGIQRGSNLSLTDIVILNNYTDFRDIDMSDQGCTVAALWDEQENLLVGQTWDMHSTAKEYVSLIEVPSIEDRPPVVVFTLVGCVGMMGVSLDGIFLGVNNINTNKATSGVMWPVLVRQALMQGNLDGLKQCVSQAPVTSGHNYIMADKDNSACLEVSPGLSEEVLTLNRESSKFPIFHTNHCLGPQHKEREKKSSHNSTTYDRYGLTEKKIPAVKSFDALKGMFQDHENYPRSICSHFQPGANDPSTTCGGGVLSFEERTADFWRGCPIHDTNYLQRRLRWEGYDLEWR